MRQSLERELRPGEVSLDELERAFQETEIELPEPNPVDLAAMTNDAKAEEHHTEKAPGDKKSSVSN
ncbi:hypothetical protein [Breoghania sp.]|uniref:hypothetical protein n=1 Tax=Breoghania sp. TaxID=2065378 RepID=UPI00261C8B66|nr:hypothetical protein [Breoghania sp.]MDJ0931906.1 hypothetical protein [Breoghania sp.]